MRRNFRKSRAAIRAWPFLFFLICLVTFAGCMSGIPASKMPDVTMTALYAQALREATQSFPTPTATATSSPSPSPSPTLTSTATPIRTPPDLPTTFSTTLLNPMDVPHTYLENTCQYLKDRWDPNHSAPGTVVMPIMFHSITDGDINHPYQVTHTEVEYLFRDLAQQGFEAISIQQLAGFLQHNEKIPPRSVLLIVDDLHTEEYYRQHFQAFLSEKNWVVTNAWISEPEASRRVLAGNQRLQAEGWVDHQAHGVVHNTNINEFEPGTRISTPLYGTVSGEEFTRKELEGSMKAVAEYFGKAPIAYIWPGGNFSALGVEIAREVGFQLGFTVNPRGPVMFNWVPLGIDVDPKRPSFRPESYVKDPLMVLPRYWDQDASTHLDTVRQIGKQAADYAAYTRSVELEYYDVVCQAKIGPIPTLSP